MKSGSAVALGLAAGYLLGRNRRTRLALMLSAAAATGGIGAAGRQLLRRGTKLVASSEMMSEISPAMAEITHTVRGELVDAAKSAAVAAVSGRIDALSDNLHSRAEALRHTEEPAQDTSGRVRGMAGRGGLGEEEPEEREEEAPISRHRTRRPPRPAADEEEEDQADEDEEDHTYEEEEEYDDGEERAEEPQARRRLRPAPGSAPIRRAQR